ncbi:MAG: ATP-dependent DNA helicase RecG [Candidatus Stahlbacteria bacterium]|nr:ATP-dependent DNA helicase RecG [Candidatus Stahlbacteria bacterium]
MNCTVDTSVMYLKGVGPGAAEVLKNIGVEKVGDLLMLIPVRYVRRCAIKDVSLNEDVQVVGRIIGTCVKRTSRGPVFVVHITDGTGSDRLPNPKHQIPNKFQISNLKQRTGDGGWGAKSQILPQMRDPEKSGTNFNEVQEFKSSRVQEFKSSRVQGSNFKGEISISFFNYPQKARAKFEYNKLIEVEGQVSIWGNELQLVNPGVSFVDCGTEELKRGFQPTLKKEGLLPMYPLSQWLTHRYIRKIVRKALEVKIPETLPNSIVEAEGLLGRAEAIRGLHFPLTLEYAGMARKRLEFEELFWLQILVAIRRKQIQATGISFKGCGKLGQKFLASVAEDRRQKMEDRSQNSKFQCWKVEDRIWRTEGKIPNPNGVQGSRVQEFKSSRVQSSKFKGQEENTPSVPPAVSSAGQGAPAPAKTGFVNKTGMSVGHGARTYSGRGMEFKLTVAQSKALSEIYVDMESGNRMNRLLQGDVGSGKTIVAILSMLKAVESGYQAVLMAPTEVLAEQHYLNLYQYLSIIGIRVELLTGSQSGLAKKEVQQSIGEGTANIIVGTHSLIEGVVKFHNLGLVVIDEQHKFGVEQRFKLVNKAGSPDVLVMTATPIPRSLSLTVYGDLDISVIDEMPPGVGEIETRWVYEDKIGGVWEYVISEIRKGAQVFVVYPVIEETEKLDVKAAVAEYENLRAGVLKEYRVGLLHGRMNNKEKAWVMGAFRDGELDVLVATTVIEVGIDVPNASCMVIEHSERFGLAQLHQLRGRLRRGVGKATCILVSPRGVSEIGKERLNSIVREEDGFKLAEKDLELRGIGEFFGTKQHGLPGMKFATSVLDTRLLAHIRGIAFKIIEEDPELEDLDNLVLKTTLMRVYKEKVEFLGAG